MHVAGTQNSAADFLSWIDLNPKEKVELKIRDDITICPIQVNLQSIDVADEEQLFFLPDTNSRAFDYRTFKSNSRTNRKAPRDHEKDPRMPIKVLLPGISKKNQTVGYAM